MTKKSVLDLLRAEYVQIIANALTTSGEEVLRVGSNEIALPVVDSEGDDQYVVIKVQVPTGSRDGDAYDAYGLAQEYAMHQAEKAEKKAQAEEKKRAKIARDEERRRQMAEARERAKAGGMNERRGS